MFWSKVGGVSWAAGVQRLENAPGVLLIRHSIEIREAVLGLCPGRLEVGARNRGPVSL